MDIKIIYNNKGCKCLLLDNFKFRQFKCIILEMWFDGVGTRLRLQQSIDFSQSNLENVMLYIFNFFNSLF